MRGTLLIARREIVSYLMSSTGWLILGVVLLAQGLLFNAVAMAGEKKSFDVVQLFFYFSSGTTMVASIFISMRLFAEEKQLGTLVLLETSPMTEWQVVLGKFFGGWVFLCLLLVLSIYMPLLVLVNGKITIGHLVSGYLGLALLGSACIAIGTFASSVAQSQVLAAVIAGGGIVALVLAWMLARKVDGSLGDVIGYLDLFDKHFRAFSRGTVKLGSVVYFLSLTYVALLSTTAVIGARRWRG
ncbi:MAG TPA: ABC transporter permease subunit [Myxococcota bacterium]